MSRTEGTKAVQLLEKYLKDESKELLWSDENESLSRYEFKDWTKELEDEQRVRISFFVIYKNDTEDSYCDRSTRKQQKFLCVNGPLNGEKITEKTAKEERYLPFNNASTRQDKIPSVILVHKDSLST